MFERFTAELIDTALGGDPEGDVLDTAIAAVKRSGLVRECIREILACVLGCQPAEAAWCTWLDEAEQEAIAAFALNPTREGACAAIIDVLQARGIGFDILGRWAWLN